MRINRYIALAIGLSRRKAEDLVANGLITINGEKASLSSKVENSDVVKFEGKIIRPAKTITILLNKPVSYVCSRRGQGSKTVYDLLPENLKHLKTVGRLDKDSSGLILLTNDGELANIFTHPRYSKTKTYEIKLDKPLASDHKDSIEKGMELEDGLSKLRLKPLHKTDKHWQVTMGEGRNRQIRRTFAALGYEVLLLNRTGFGKYSLGQLKPGEFKTL